MINKKSTCVEYEQEKSPPGKFRARNEALPECRGTINSMRIVSVPHFLQEKVPLLKAPLRVLFVGAEAAPFVKVGGLGEVLRALPKAMRELGCDARVDRKSVV